MSPTQFHAKKLEITSTNNNINGLLPPPLKINKDSHLIKKSSSSSSSLPSSSSSSSSTSTSSSLGNNGMAPTVPASSNKPPQRHPVIIYTHSPKVIHTHPRDFMALVQKLTGLTRSDDGNNNNNSPAQQQSKQEPGSRVAAVVGDKENDHKNVVVVRNEDNETSSVITEENNCSSCSNGENQVNSCLVTAEPSMMEPQLNPYMTNLPVGEFMCSSQPLLNYADSLFFSHNMRTSIPSSATLEGMKDFRQY